MQLTICLGSRCADYGGRELLRDIHHHGVEADAMGCQSLCTYSPVMRIDDQFILRASLQHILDRKL